MKKYISLLLIITLIFSLTACRRVSDNDSEYISVTQEIIKENVKPTDNNKINSSYDENSQEDSKNSEKTLKQSTIIAPTTVTFYKNGAKVVSDDKEFNHKIAKHIESFFINDSREGITIAHLAATTDDIREMKRNEMAIELQFDNEINFSGGVISDGVRTLFIPITGKHKYLLFKNHITSPDNWSGPIGGVRDLEQFFEGIQFAPLTAEQKRWQSTIVTPHNIDFYASGKYMGESEIFAGYALNYEIATKVESWFYKKESVPTVNVYETPIETAWENETYLKLFFNCGPTFYGEQIVNKESYILIIPLTGKYAYHIFEGMHNQMLNVAIDIKGSGLEEYFERIIKSNNS